MDTREIHLPPRLELRHGSWFETESTRYEIHVSQGREADESVVILKGFNPQTGEPKKTEITDQPVAVVRAVVGQPAFIRFARPVDGQPIAITSPVVELDGLLRRTAVLSVGEPPDWSDLPEADRIRWEAELEQVRFRDFPVFRDDDEIDECLRTGQLFQLVDNLEVGFKVVARNRLKYPFTNYLMRDLIYELVTAWRTELRARGLDPLARVLIITSLVRTVAYQEQLRAQGYPAAIRSTHCNGFAVDVAKKWFVDNAPDYATAFEAVLARFVDQGRITVIHEDNIGCWHIALRLDWLGRQPNRPTGLVIAPPPDPPAGPSPST